MTCKRSSSTGLSALKINQVENCIQETMVGLKSSWYPWLFSVSLHSVQMICLNIELMFADYEPFFDTSLVLRRGSKNEAGWLTLSTQKWVQEERETLEQGLERKLEAIPYLPHSCRSSLTQRLSQPASSPFKVCSFHVLSMGDDCV